MSTVVLYGVPGKYKDVSQLVLEHCISSDGTALLLPGDDHQRAKIFGDHVPNVLKHLVLLRVPIVTVLEQGKDSVLNECIGFYAPFISTADRRKLEQIHSRLTFIGGKIRDELPEQLMAVKFIPPSATVLEIGANIGRNTLTIASLIDDSSRFVTLEPDPNSAAMLARNRDANKFAFRIEDCALSARRLQLRGWNSCPIIGDGAAAATDSQNPAAAAPALLDGHREIKTMSWPVLRQKYENLKFDTLVADCEGALYYILQDEPTMLESFSLIIVENDYTDLSHKAFVDSVVTKSGFQRAYIEPGGWGPCEKCFYEVWKK